MNEARLQKIFRNYVERFDELNAPDPGNDEKYKWEIAFDFRDRMDAILHSPAEIMADELKKLIDSTWNLLQNKWELPGTALCEYCDIKREPETVRSLLTALFADDGGDLNIRQKKILTFIEGCGKLQSKYFPDSFLYTIEQRATMVLLGLYDPDNNYIFKATQAREFAACAEFFEDWGPSTRFNLSIYYKMCDRLVEYMRADEELMKTHYSRYEKYPGPMHKDNNLHILAFDIIYCSTEYHLMNNIEYGHISSAERKKHIDNQNAAEALAKKLEIARTELELYHEAISFYQPYLIVGSDVFHKKYGKGTVIDFSGADGGNKITVSFPNFGAKEFEAEKSVVNDYLQIDGTDMAETNAEYRNVINKGEKTLRAEIRRIENAIEPLRDYLS